ncbi:hypothetical protein Bca4012_059077 [Brassica carinata]|uniref:Uncharacterized protein n=1 Tax=Brassica carinata TaxID=52824 RepID=A0A8X7W485_BRACI|nr:hypothetical protein Bca52824_016811 [Brassica carinata]
MLRRYGISTDGRSIDAFINLCAMNPLIIALMDSFRLSSSKGTVMKGFIPPERIDTYLRHMVPGSTYRLNSFFGSKAKDVYRVADPDVVISFSWKSVLSVLKDNSIRFPEDRFRFHGYEQFESACDLKGDLLVNEQALTESLVIDEAEVASTR